MDNAGAGVRVAFVTGGAQGIGRAIALALARAGTDVAIADINPDGVAAAVAEITATGRRAWGFVGDVSSLAFAQEADAKTVAAAGALHVLVNNAGITRDGLLLRMKPEDWELVLKVNLTGAFNFCKAAVPVLVKQRWGRIVNISSIFGKQPGGLLDYDSLKAALIMITKDFSNRLAKDNILVNAVCPGPIRTPLWDGPGQMADSIGKELGMTIPQVMKWFAEQNIPLGHHGEPEDIANMVTFLASDRAKFITGQAINVDGGMVKCLI